MTLLVPGLSSFTCTRLRDDERDEVARAGLIYIGKASDVLVFGGIGALRTNHVQALADDARGADVAPILPSPFSTKSPRVPAVPGLLGTLALAAVAAVHPRFNRQPESRRAA